MELFHPFRARREKKTKEQVLSIASRASAQIIDHLSENGDIELRIQVGKPPRKVMPADFLGAIAAQVDVGLEARAPNFANRLAYDDVASRRASMHVVKTREIAGDMQADDWRDEIDESGLTMVLAPVSQEAESRQA